MKKSLLIISLFFAFLFGAFAQNTFEDNFELTRLIVNLNGTAYNGKAILAYGDGGVILRSPDGGQSWDRIALNDSLKILGIVNIGQKFVGLCSQKYAISSTDDGKTWETTQIGNKENFSQLLYSNGKLLALLSGQLRVYDENLYKLNQYDYESSSKINNCAVVGSKAVIATGKGKLTTIDLGSGEQEELSLKDLGLCASCPDVSRLIAGENNTVYFTLDYDLCKLDIESKTGTKLKRMPNNDTLALATYNGDLFAAYTNRFDTERMDSLYFSKFNASSSSFKRINDPVNDYSIYGIYPREVKFLSADTVIAVGARNLIYFSTDGGAHWNLKSYLGEIFEMRAFGPKELRAFGKHGRFYYSTDGGVTWLPPENYIKYISESKKFEYPYNSGECFYFRDKLNGYIYVKNDHTRDTNVVYTNDGGRTISSKFDDDLTRKFFENYALEYKGNTLFFAAGKTLGDWWTIVAQIDDKVDTIYINSFKNMVISGAFVDGEDIYALGKDIADADSVYAVYISTDGGKSWNKDFSFPTVAFPLNRAATITNIGNIIYADFIYGLTDSSTGKNTSYQKLYRIDVKNKKSDLILHVAGEQLFKPILIDNKCYVQYYNIGGGGMEFKFLYSDINSAEPEWKELSINRFGPVFKPAMSGDSLLVFNAYDSLMKSDQYFLAKPKGNTGVAERPQREKLKEIAITGPLASSQAGEYEFNVTMDEKAIAEKMTLAAYDVRGSRVGSDFLLTPGGAGQGRLLWKPGKLPPGAYVLILKCGSSIGSTTVVVE